MSGFVINVSPAALRRWEKALANAAIGACTERGGTALIGDDRVVSCMPWEVSNGRRP
jgi:hypothetical protein